KRDFGSLAGQDYLVEFLGLSGHEGVGGVLGFHPILVDSPDRFGEHIAKLLAGGGGSIGFVQTPDRRCGSDRVDPTNGVHWHYRIRSSERWIMSFTADMAAMFD